MHPHSHCFCAAEEDKEAQDEAGAAHAVKLENPSRGRRQRWCWDEVEGNQASAGRLQSHPRPQPILTWSPGFRWCWRGASLCLVWGWGAYGLRSNLHRRPGRQDALWNWRKEQQWWHICTQAERGQSLPDLQTSRYQDQQTAGLPDQQAEEQIQTSL